MDYFKQSEYGQMVARKERELDRMLAATEVEETEEEFGVADGAFFPRSNLVWLLVFFRLLHISDVKTRA